MLGDGNNDNHNDPISKNNDISDNECIRAHHLHSLISNGQM